MLTQTFREALNPDDSVGRLLLPVIVFRIINICLNGPIVALTDTPNAAGKRRQTWTFISF